MVDKLEKLEIDQQGWERCCRTMLMHIESHRFEAAKKVLEVYLENVMPVMATLNSRLSNVVPLKMANSLEMIGVFTVQDVFDSTDAKLLAAPNFGFKHLRDVRDICNKVYTGRFKEIDNK